MKTLTQMTIAFGAIFMASTCFSLVTETTIGPAYAALNTAKKKVTSDKVDDKGLLLWARKPAKK